MTRTLWPSRVFKCTGAILMLANLAMAQSVPDLSGTWAFTQGDNLASGTIVLYQSGNELSGTWHTAGEKAASDTLVAARILGTTVMLNRAVGGGQNTYILTLSSDGNRLEGVGQGSRNHEKLILVKTGPAPKRPQSAGPQKQSMAAPTGSQTPGSGPTDVLPKATKQKWMGIGLPPQRGTYRWQIQSVATPGSKSGKKYSSFYYEVSTGRSVEEPLSLPAGGEIVGVFPDDCMFGVQDQTGHSFTFRNEKEAQTRGLGPGTWSVYPLKCAGIEVYVK
jgi:hypothetical protein